MRDALSLLDQVIAFGGGKLTAADTRTMLGTLDRSQVFSIVDALLARDARAVLDRVNELDERAPDYREVLAELAALLQKLALLQAVPDLQLDEAEDIETYRRLAAALTPEDAQLYYQIAVVGRRDLELAPDARAGFEMTLLRMLAFGAAEPSARSASSSSIPAVQTVGVPKSTAAASRPTVATAHPATAPVSAASGDDWAQAMDQMNLQGPVRQLAAHCVLRGRQGAKVLLQLDPEGELYKTAAMEAKLTQALSGYYGEPVRIEFSVGAPAVATPARQQKAAAEDKLQNAHAALGADPNVRAMQDIFGATLQPDSIRPND